MMLHPNSSLINADVDHSSNAVGCQGRVRGRDGERNVLTDQCGGLWEPNVVDQSIMTCRSDESLDLGTNAYIIFDPRTRVHQNSCPVKTAMIGC